MEATAKAKSGEAPKAQMFSLKTPYMKQGRVTQTGLRPIDWREKLRN